MFDQLTTSLSDVFSKFRAGKQFRPEDVADALRQIRRALLEADVALPVVRNLTETIQKKTEGMHTLKDVDPAQQIVKIVHDEILSILTASESQDAALLDINNAKPAVILMAGLQGSGKTTSSGKLAKYLKEGEGKKILLASLDDRRPAAQEQLQILAQNIGVDNLPIIAEQSALDITDRAMDMARQGGYDLVILDTAGRMAIDVELMAEIKIIKDKTQPNETLLVADSLTGQDAVMTAEQFHNAIGVTGIILTRLDGDSRGGAALSMRAVTGQAIKFMGMGEDIAAIEVFHPERIASRILGMGDVVSLVEKAIDNIDETEAMGMMEKFKQGIFDYNDLLMQMRQMEKMGGMGGIASLLPGMNKIKQKIEDANIDQGVLKRQEAIIGSMTAKERKNPALVNHSSRKKRIARGAGVSINEVNKLTQMQKKMAQMMSQMQKAQDGKGGMLGKLFKNMLGGGEGNPADMPSEDDLRAMATKMQVDKRTLHKMGKAGMPQIPGMDLFGKKTKKTKKARIRLR